MTEEQPFNGDDLIGAMGAGHLYEQVADRLSDVVLGFGADCSLSYVSPSVEPVLGYSEAVFKRLYNQAMTFADDSRFEKVQEFVLRQLKRITEQAASGYECEPEALMLQHRDGFRVTLSVQCLPSIDDDGRLEGAICICRDVSARRQNLDAIALAAKAFENSTAAIYITDARGKVVQVNRAFTCLTGYSSAQTVGDLPQIIDKQHYNSELFFEIEATLREKDFWEGEIQYRHRDGNHFLAWVAMSNLRNNAGKTVNTICYFTDITQKKNSQNQVHKLAYFDSLTELPNRSLFADRIVQAINTAQRKGGCMALLFLDLDHFKNINDTVGHALGDALLYQVGQRLKECVRNVDTVARIGGDEFAVILGELSDHVQATTIATHVVEKIHRSLAEPFNVCHKELSSGVSIGIAFYPDDGSDPNVLLQKADTAMYHAKSMGRNCYQFFTEEMNKRARERLELETALRYAVKRQEFELFYQPIFSMHEGEGASVEALLRWQKPACGPVTPADFFDVAEESGLFRMLSCWVLRQACLQWKDWRRRGQPIDRIGINVSARQFTDESFLPLLRDTLRSTGVPAGAIELELKESALMHDCRFTRESLAEISDLGVRVAIDNFGAGYSSLNQLKELPVSSVKIDRSFVAGLPSSGSRRAIQAITAMAKGLDFHVVIEGVETAEQMEFLQQIDCDAVQGYLLSEPLSPQYLAAGIYGDWSRIPQCLHRGA